ncbi:MAG: PKD domain-containing protein [Bacteroidota bacterium]
MEGEIISEEQPTIVFENPGLYEVQMTAENEFGSSTTTESIRIFNSEDLIIDQVSSNPSEGIIQLEMGSDIPQEFYATIFDTNGQLLHQHSEMIGYKCLSPHTFTFPQNLKNGLYAIRFSIGDVQKSMQVVLMR